MTQKTAEPAPASQNNGNEHTPTTAYCCAKLNSRPVINIQKVKFIIQQIHEYKLSRRIRKPTTCIGENKGADQLCSNCTADQHHCFPSPIDITMTAF